MSDAVIDEASVATTGDQPIQSKTRQLLRHHGLLNAKAFLQLAHRLFSLREEAENDQSRVMGECLEKVARVARASQKASADPDRPCPTSV